MNDIKHDIMEAIRRGDVHMRPRWQFVLTGALFALSVVLVVLVITYAASLVIFFLERSGAWFAPSFGGRGWLELFRSLPWLIILALLAALAILEILVRRYSFAYRRPVLGTTIAVLALIGAGTAAIALSPLHQELESFAYHHLLPEPLGAMYRPPYRLRDENIFRGVIAAAPRPVALGSASSTMLIVDRMGATTTIMLGPRTRFPMGTDFEAGEAVVVVGDLVASGTVQAFGIREIDPDPDYGD